MAYDIKSGSTHARALAKTRAHSLRERSAPRLLTLMAASCLLTTGKEALADPDFGVYGYEAAQLTLSAPFLSQYAYNPQSFSMPGMQPATELNMAQLTAAAQVGLPEPYWGLQADYAAVGSISNGQLHGSVSASANNVVTCLTNDCSASHATAQVYELWIDHLTVTAPAGVRSVEISYTTFFEGVVSADGPYVLDGVGNPLSPTSAAFYSNVQNTVQQTNPQEVLTHTYGIGGDTGSFRDVVTHTISVLTNVPFEIELQMNLNAAAGTLFGPSVSLANAMNTGGIYFSSNVEGVQFSSASGVSYEAPTSVPTAPVPEPSTWALVALGLSAIVLRGRKRTGSFDASAS